MHVLMLSLDSTLMTDPHGNARARHLDYATRCGKLTIIVRTRGGSSSPVQASPALTLIPSASRHPILFPWDAYRIGRALDDIDLIVTQDQFTSGLPGVWLRGYLRKPVLVQNHSTIFDNPAWREEKPFRNRLLLALATYVRGHADFVRTVNERERNTAINAGIPAERLASLPLGTITSAFAKPPMPTSIDALRAKLGLSVEQKVMLWVGYPSKVKRVPLLLQVFTHLVKLQPNARLLIVGDMRYSSEDIPALIRQYNVEGKVIMPGNADHDALPAYYAMATVYVHTSSYEGVPRVMMEAASVGTPLVGIRAAGVEEIVVDGVNGYLFDETQLEAMAHKIGELFDHSAQARALGAAGRERALKLYSAEDYAERWVGIWQRAAALGMRA